MHTLGFPATADPFGHRDPVVVNVPGLLREIILALTGEPALSGPDRDDLSRVLLRSLAPVPSVHLHLPYPADDRLARVAGALTDDPGDARSLGELGAAAGASERTLSRLFRQQTGMTFPQWRAQLRLQHGLTLLAAGQPVTAVAHGCGYGSPSAFTAAFRDAFGMTPSDAFGRVTTSGRG
jgi:AraC-like DNA-binding protein